MEPNRSWHDPVVEIFGNLITPGVRYSAEAYDFANRRWYRLDADSPDVPDDGWLSATVTKHIQAHHTTHNATPPWNTITLPSPSPSPSPSNHTTFSTRRNSLVGRPISTSLSYGVGRGGASPPFPPQQLPTTPVRTLQQLTYLSRSADRCRWRGRACVFKRVEFDVDVEVIEAEIRAREALRDAILSSASSSSSSSSLVLPSSPHTADVDLDAEMARQFCVVPILAVVIADREPWEHGTVAGVLMPFCGRDLEMLARPGAGEGVSVTVAQLAELVRGARRLGECGVVHGDIKYWNTVLQQREGEEGAKLMMIDLGTVAPEYEGDAKALGTLLLWCVENAKGLMEDAGVKARVVAAAAALRAEEDFDSALACLVDD